MVTLARESRGMTMGELASRAGVTASLISKVELGQRDMSEETAKSVAASLDYPVDVFTWKEPVYGFGSSSFYHRKQQSLPQKKLRQIQAFVNFQRIRTKRLSAALDLDFSFTIPSLSVDDYGSPEEIARAVRAAWRVPIGPIQNLTEWIEAAGGFVVAQEFDTAKINAISVWPPGEHPFFVVNTLLPACNLRFSLAHELGHLVMHDVPEPGQEQEADRFAAEFLMPAVEIKPQLRAMNLRLAARLKPVWRTSMGALIRRARDLEVISDRQHTSLRVQLSQNGWTKQEPVSIPHEAPSLIPEIVRVHHVEHGYSASDLADMVGLHTPEWLETYEPRGLRAV
ncbi:ImmA/IrrE family metallo-endopeptidase [Streptomyces sp. PKU-EA00015]|uniref:ImmA/IrrE family metallo-endopeptidase n=1 Tax=Streptomyces sp. PKU-EA00015 TaxID=2748326 RepID=UPI0015A3BA6B|nr:XRE family transcriptional regulator [Streptomyces sp. PKU-EA00015]NWF31214.1 ImmA/IrrE family metallo-endopeptidase [Streptomyces sp. PKU-EA00015]